jgi:hypothetical protein
MLNPPRLRLGVALIIVLMVISSPIVMLANPALTAAQSNNIDTSSKHSGFSLGDSSTPPMSPTNVLPLDSDFTTQAALSSLTARPTNNIVNTNSFYDVVFLTATAGTIKTIQVTFPVGTTIPSTAFFNEAEKCVPGSNCTVLTGTASKSGQTITYTVTNAVNVPAGTKIRLEFANINNPLNPSANYKVTVTTRNAANTPIDGPTASTAYTMKQIGKNAIAESFMKRVTLTDSVASNDLGWNPDGVETLFSIFDTNAVYNEAIVVVNVCSEFCGGIPLPCFAGKAFGGSFALDCEVAPPNGAELHYQITVLPAHIF